MKKKLLLLCIPVLMLFPLTSAFASFGSNSASKPATSDSTEAALKSVPEAMKEFKSLSKAEKKSRMKEMKKAIKEFKAAKKRGDEVSTNTLLLVLVALFIPPLAVYLHEGETNNRFWISVLLTILGLVLFSFGGVLFLGTLPAIIYALIVILGN
ncbi:MAG TPA: YqaE/Pmp3 family membrane protein [Segetibacter sp.]|jgi:uncharacterized membrane protein YqaE (UPF0057 family)